MYKTTITNTRMTKHTINIVNDSKIMYINIDTTYQVALKHASTLTVFKDTRHGIYVTFFGMRLLRTSLDFDFYFTF